MSQVDLPHQSCDSRRLRRSVHLATEIEKDVIIGFFRMKGTHLEIWNVQHVRIVTDCYVSVSFVASFQGFQEQNLLDVDLGSSCSLMYLQSF